MCRCLNVLTEKQLKAQTEVWTLLVHLRCGDSVKTPLSLPQDGETSSLTVLSSLKSECRADTAL